jgi:hypothetical protein
MNKNNSSSSKQNNATKSKKTAANRAKRLKRNANKRQAKQIVNARIPGTTVAQCTKSYVRALTNPFTNFRELPCIPDTLVNPSFKFSSKCQGIFTTGATGVGWVTVNPWFMCYNNGTDFGVASSKPVACTDISYPLGIYSWQVVAGVPTLGVVTSNSNSQFTFADFANNGWDYRLVACGLKVKYIGSSFRNQGRYIVYREQGNDPVPNPVMSSTLLTDQYSNTCPVNGTKEVVVTYQPAEFTYTSYKDHAFYQPLNTTPTSQIPYTMLIYVEGGDTEIPQAFEYEVVAYFEVLGRRLTLTPSHSDPVGFGQAVAALPNRIPLTSPAVVENQLMKNLVEGLRTGISYAMPIAAHYGKQAISHYLSY